MSERVSIVEGADDNPIILVCPHGIDDPLTAVITENIAKEIDAWAVINRGWKRGEEYNYENSIANCNNVEHCMKDVVREEFLEPYVRMVNRLENVGYSPNVFILHGMRTAEVDIIVGYGEGKKPRHSCSLDFKDVFTYLLEKNAIKAGVGKAGGTYSGHSKSNLNQYWQCWDGNINVHSMQLEISKALRDDDNAAEATSELLAAVFDDYADYMEVFYSRTSDPTDKFDADWRKIAQGVPQL